MHILPACIFFNQKDEDFEGDFNPEQHDKRMRQLFDSEYYGRNDSKKPEFPELDEELEIGKQMQQFLM